MLLPYFFNEVYNMDEIIMLEMECDEPINWVTDTVFIRNEKGEIVELDVPDDVEEV